MLLLESWSPPLHQKTVHLQQVLGELSPLSGWGGTMVGLKSAIRWQGAPPEGSQAPSSSHPDAPPPPASGFGRAGRATTRGWGRACLTLGTPPSRDWRTCSGLSAGKQKCLCRGPRSGSVQLNVDHRTGALHFFTSLLHKSALPSSTAQDQLSVPNVPRRHSLTRTHWGAGHGGFGCR